VPDVLMRGGLPTRHERYHGRGKTFKYQEVVGGRGNQNAARLGSQSYSPKFKLVSVKFLYNLQKVNKGRKTRQPYALVKHGKQGHHMHILQV